MKILGNYLLPRNYSSVYNNQDRKNSYNTNFVVVSDSVTFGATKKSQYSGFDLFCVEKYKAPIEKFKTPQDLQLWARAEAEKLINQQYKGRFANTEAERKKLLNQWSDYVLNQNDAYTNTISLIILKSIIKNCKANNNSIPPVLNKGVLAQTVSDMDFVLKHKSDMQFDFLQVYQDNLVKNYFSPKQVKHGDLTDWICIPSKKHSPKNFEENVDKLKALSHPNWCTKSFNAEPYLAEGSFHVYLENGEPKLGLRFVKGKIEEIQGVLNNDKIPVKYVEEVCSHISENHYKFTEHGNIQFKKLLATCDGIETIGKNLQNKSQEEIFDFFNIKYKKDKDGLYIISNFEQPHSEYTFEEIGIDTAKLLYNVKRINGNADLKQCSAKDLSNLAYIGGNADFTESKIENLSNLKYIGKDAIFKNCKVALLDNLEHVGASLMIDGAKNLSIPKITELKNLYVYRCQNLEMSNLAKVDDLYMVSSNGVRYDKLEQIFQSLRLRKVENASLDSLKQVGKNVELWHCENILSKNLENIGASLVSYDSHIAIPKLNKIRRLIRVSNSMFENSENENKMIEKFNGGWTKFSSTLNS